jgi:predicted aspartyl protease
MKTNFVYITVNNNQTPALVDTGAVISCITEQHLRKVIKHYKLELLKDTFCDWCEQ